MEAHPHTANSWTSSAACESIRLKDRSKIYPDLMPLRCIIGANLLVPSPLYTGARFSFICLSNSERVLTPIEKIAVYKRSEDEGRWRSRNRQIFCIVYRGSELIFYSEGPPSERYSDKFGIRNSSDARHLFTHSTNVSTILWESGLRADS